MIDGCGREIDHLRLSLTDRCNLACRYCVPSERPQVSQMIDAEFAYRAVRWLVCEHGIRHVRLTGGEPLLHPGLTGLVERLSKLDDLRELTLTTNAQTLAGRAKALRAAGLTRVNVSLDTLRPERFEHVTRGGKLERTLAGIESAVAAGLTPVKINIVAQRGLNGDEFRELAEWGLARGCVVRFLEVMPLGPLAHTVRRHLIPAAEVLRQLKERFELREIPHRQGRPAVDYAVEAAGVRGVISIIAPTTRPFCSCCRRLRITSHGELVPCVHDREREDLTRAWDGRVLDEAEADAIVRRAVAGKRAIGPKNQTSALVTIGG